jgi:hypothetical protein
VGMRAALAGRVRSGPAVLNLGSTLAQPPVFTYPKSNDTAITVIGNYQALSSLGPPPDGKPLNRWPEPCSAA